MKGERANDIDTGTLLDSRNLYPEPLCVFVFITLPSKLNVLGTGRVLLCKLWCLSSTHFVLSILLPTSLQDQPTDIPFSMRFSYNVLAST